MISSTKFFVSLFICIVSVYLGLWVFNSCLYAISYPSTTMNMVGIMGLFVEAFCAFKVVQFLKGYCS